MGCAFCVEYDIRIEFNHLARMIKKKILQGKKMKSKQYIFKTCT